MGWKWNASKRVVAAEFRAARWLARNPEWMLAPSAVAAGACTLGPTTTGYVLGGAAGATGFGTGVTRTRSTRWPRRSCGPGSVGGSGPTPVGAGET